MSDFPDSMPTPAEIDALMAADAAAQAQADADRAAALAAASAPLTPPTITGTTVAGVKASADAAVKQLAQDFTDRLSTVIDQLGT